MKRLIVLLLITCLLFPSVYAEQIVLPSGLLEIDDDAFANASSITDVVVPDGVTSIGSNAFGNCSNLTSILLPDSVTEIAADAFEGSNNVTAIVEFGSVAEQFCKSNGINYVQKPGANEHTSSDYILIFNDHKYQFVPNAMTWNSARSWCEARGGHLLTINSSSEQEAITSWLFSNFSFGRIWLGLVRPNWNTWITGEPVIYSNWGRNQPDNSWSSPQNCGAMANYNQGTILWPGAWDDWSGQDEYEEVFVCEWDYSYFLKWDDDSVARKILNVEKEQSVNLFTIHTNTEWTASYPNWVVLRPESGDPGQTDSLYTLEATIQKNESTEERTGEIVISANNCKSLVLKITQAANVPESVTLSCETWNLGWETGTKGQSILVKSEVKGTSNKKVTYSSSNHSVATINMAGRITVVGQGDTTITVKTANGVSDSHVMHVHAYPFKYEKFEVAIRKSNNWLAKLIDLYYLKMDTDADVEIESIMNSFESLFSGGISMAGKTIDDDAKQEFKERMLGVARGFKSADRVTTYTDCKTSVDLAKKVMKAMVVDGEGEFSFTCKNITYTCTYNTVGIFNNDFSQITMKASDGQTYMWSLITSSPKSIEAEMKYLKQFADLKIQEARDAAYSDMVKTLGIGEYIKAVENFFDDIKNTYKGKAWSVIQSTFPDLAALVEGAQELKSKFDGVKNAYNGLKPPDWTGDLGTKVIQDITGYHEKVNALIAAVEALVP